MLKRIRPTTWEEVFQDWKQREGSDPGWIHCATVDDAVPESTLIRSYSLPCEAFPEAV